MLATLKELLTDLIGTDNTSIVDGVLVPDYAFIITGVLVIVMAFIIIKGVFALCKR